MMGYNSQTKVILVNLPKKLSFWARVIWIQFGPKSCNPVSDLLSKDFFEVLCHDEALDKSSLSHFSKKKKLPFWAIQAYLIWHSMIRYNGQTKVMLVNFSKKLLFGEVTRTQFEPILCNLLSYYLLCENFFKMLQHERIQQVYNSNSQFYQKISFGANGKFGPNLGQNYANLYLFKRLQHDGAYYVDISYGS